MFELHIPHLYFLQREIKGGFSEQIMGTPINKLSYPLPDAQNLKFRETDGS